MSEPMLSWIIGSFNRPNSMRTCLSSIIDQTFTDWEAIVTDNSEDRIVMSDGPAHSLRVDP